MKSPTSLAAVTLAIAMSAVLAIGACTKAVRNDLSSTLAQRFNWPVDKTSIRELKWDGIDACQIYDAYDERVLDGLSIGVARLKDGSLIIGKDPDALDRVFARCISANTHVGTLADVLISFSQYRSMRVLQDNSLGVGRDLLKKAGRKFAAPQVSVEQGTRVVRFFALSPDGLSLLQITGRIGQRVTVEGRALSGLD